MTKHQPLPHNQEFLDHLSTESGFIDDDLFESPYLDTFNPAGNLLLNSPSYPEAFRDGGNTSSSVLPIPSDLDTSKESLPSINQLKQDKTSRRSEFFNPISSTESLPSAQPVKLNSFRPVDKKVRNGAGQTGSSANKAQDNGPVTYCKPVSDFLWNNITGEEVENQDTVDSKLKRVDTGKPVANVLPSPSIHQDTRPVPVNGVPVHSDSSNSVKTVSTKDGNSSVESLNSIGNDKFNTIVPARKDNDNKAAPSSHTKPVNTVMAVQSTQQGITKQLKKIPPKPPPRTVTNTRNHLSNPTAHLEPPYAKSNIPSNVPSDTDSDYMGVGAKRKSFRIPAENFVEYHNPQGIIQGHNKYQPAIASPRRVRDRKSDSIEKLESNEFLLSPPHMDPNSIESSFMGRYFNDCSSSFNPSSSSSNRDSTASSASSGSGSTNASSGSRPALKKDSLHYAATNIVSLPQPSLTKVHRTSKQDTTQALQSLRKRVQIVQDESALRLLPSTIPPDCSTKVTFPAATWDLMMQNFRIALSMDNVFICDHFLGREPALLLHQELQMLKQSGHIERHMQSRAGNPDYMKYACVFLTEPDRSLPRIDGLVLMIYKLAHYYVSDWAQISVQISYYPNGHTEEHLPKQETAQRFLKCVYFANLPLDEAAHPGQQGRYYVDQHGRETSVEPTFDRLLAFWGDSMAHKMEGYPRERFVINVWMAR